MQICSFAAPRRGAYRPHIACDARGRRFDRRFSIQIKTMLLMGALALAATCAATVEASAGRTVSLVGQPLVMRLNGDEFRFAFGIDGRSCLPAGCSGLIHYRVRWKTADGIAHSDVRRVSYQVSPAAARTITVDRQYLDTAEGAHTTDIVAVTVDRITASLNAAAARRSPDLR